MTAVTWVAGRAGPVPGASTTEQQFAELYAATFRPLTAYCYVLNRPVGTVKRRLLDARALLAPDVRTAR